MCSHNMETAAPVKSLIGVHKNTITPKACPLFCAKRCPEVRRGKDCVAVPRFQADMTTFGWEHLVLLTATFLVKIEYMCVLLSFLSV